MSTGASSDGNTLSPQNFVSALSFEVVEQLRKMYLFDLANLVHQMNWTGAKTVMYRSVLRLVNADEYQVLEEYLSSDTGEGIIRKDFLLPVRTFCIHGPIRLCDNYYYIYQKTASTLAKILSFEGNAGIYGLYAPRFSGKTTFLLQLIPFLEHWNLEVACITCCRNFKPQTFAELGQKAMASIAKSSFSTELAKARACEWLAIDEAMRPDNFLAFLCDSEFQEKKLVILWDDFDFISENPSIIASLSSMLVHLQDGLFLGGYLAFRSLVLVGSHHAAWKPFGIIPRKIFGPDFLKISPDSLLQNSYEFKDARQTQKFGYTIDIRRGWVTKDSLNLYARTAGHAGIIGIMCHVLESGDCLKLTAGYLIDNYDGIVEAIYSHPAFREIMESLDQCSDSTKQLLLELCSTYYFAHDADSVEQANLLRIGFAKFCGNNNRYITVPSEFFRIMAWRRLWVGSLSKPMSLNSVGFRVDLSEILCELLGQIRPEIIANSPKRKVPLIRYSTAVAEVMYRINRQSPLTVIPQHNFRSLLFYDKSSRDGFAISFCDSYERDKEDLAELHGALGLCWRNHALIHVSGEPDSRTVERKKQYFEHHSIYALYHDYDYKNAKIWYYRDYFILKEGQYLPYNDGSHT